MRRKEAGVGGLLGNVPPIVEIEVVLSFI